MKITDEKVLNLLRKHRLYSLATKIFACLEDEARGGRTDMDVFKDELAYLLYEYQEEGNSYCEELEEARYVLKWSDSEVDKKIARDVINDYRRTVAMGKRI